MSLSRLYQNNYSHIYIERDVQHHDRTISILEKLKGREIIYIDSYKEIFNRPRQDFLIQKRSQKLILAKKREEFLYKGSNLCEDFGNTNFYYTSNILNCIYDCEYCYLKSLYNSSNIVIFVNVEDCLKEINKISNQNPYIALSYDSDLLAFEALTGFCKDYIEYAKNNENVLFEIRTKSANFKLIEHLGIPKNVIIAWTLLPDEVINIYEDKTPDLYSRLNSIKLAQSRGIGVRISIEPIVKIENFEEIYGKFIDTIFEVLDKDYIRDVNIGTFRMSNEQIKRIRKLNPYSKMFSYPLTNFGEYVSYEDEETMKNFIRDKLSNYINKNKIY